MIRGLSSRTVYENRWMRVREDEILRPDGSTGVYGVVDKPDFALVIPLEGGGVHLVEQYRYPVAERSWEFPQGTFPDRAEGDAETLARRELAEETGLRAARLEALGTLHQGPGHCSQRMHVFLATGLTPGPPRREPEEQDMRQRWVRRAELEAMIAGGAVRDSSSVAAYTLLLLRERRRDAYSAPSDAPRRRSGGASPPRGREAPEEGPCTS